MIWLIISIAGNVGLATVIAYAYRTNQRLNRIVKFLRDDDLENCELGHNLAVKEVSISSKWNYSDEIWLKVKDDDSVEWKGCKPTSLYIDNIRVKIVYCTRCLKLFPYNGAVIELLEEKLKAKALDM